MPTAYAVNWTEYERGWGARPDGHTLHVSREQAEQHVRDYMAKLPIKAPDEYSLPDDPFAVDVDAATFERVSSEGWIWGHHRQQLPAPARRF